MSEVTTTRRRGSYVERPTPSSLADVVEVILDKGLVIDAYVRVSLVGIEVLTIDARIVVASVDTYLRFAEATNRLDLTEQSRDLPEMVEDVSQSGSSGKTQGILGGVKEALTGSDSEDENDDEGGQEEEQSEQPRRSSQRETRQRSASTRRRSTSGRSSS
ncbi:gas vesicle protein GvpJ [Georgenia alba]|uniref:Gas vesicle protein A n=1 Tax=Georgenia alba TaxID=2233858 RepID=A0ABW2Q529_9MICO